MTLTPGYSDTAPPMVSGFTPGWATWSAPGAASSGTWESANRAVYYSLYVPVVTVIRRVWWANGATTTGGATIEAGVYADAGAKPGAKLISGSATQGTASQVQFVDVTDTTLTPGYYWLAVMATTTTNTTLHRNNGVDTGADAAIRFQESTGGTLPTTATPAESAVGNYWLFGFSTTTIT